MDISKLLPNLRISGELQCTCSAGVLRISSDEDSQALLVRFENGETFRYFLDSLPKGGGGASSPQKLKAMLADVPQAIQVRIGDSLLLDKPREGEPKINYLRGAWQWLRWKVGG